MQEIIEQIVTWPKVAAIIASATSTFDDDNIKFSKQAISKSVTIRVKVLVSVDENQSKICLTVHLKKTSKPQ